MSEEIKQQNTYDEESIDDISQIEGARLRPQSIGFEGHSHIFTEQLANSIDEAREGYGKVIEITKYEDDSISVRDYGRSIPLDFNSKTQKYNWRTIFLTMWGGGKYLNSQIKANYKKSTGTNGAGNFGSATTSEFFEVWSYKGSECQNIRFEEGKIVKEFNKYDDNTAIGTKTHFKPDKKCYGEYIIDDEFITDMLKRQSIINGGIKFTYTNRKNNFTKEFYYENGILDYIKELSKDKQFTNIFKFKGESFIPSKPQDFEADYEIYFTFNNSINLMEYYHNSSYLPNGGLPEKVIKNSMLDIFDKYIKTNNLYKKGEKIKFDDIIDSLIIVFSSGSTTNIFSDQTKKSIDHKELQKIITEEFKKYLEILLIENKTDADKIVVQLLINMRARVRSDNTKNTIKKKLSEKVDNMFSRVNGLIDCKYHNEESEIFISEGKSAMGSIIASRNPNLQAGYAIRGKILSCLKASYEIIFSNAVVVDLIKILGCGVEVKSKHNKELNSFNIDNLRYGRICISTDSDFDGESIQVLLLTMMYRLMPQLIIQGKVYITQTPKYVIKNKENKYYAFDDTEKDKIVSNLKGKTSINYLKGLGELDSIDMYNTALSPETRKMTKVTIGNVEKMIDKFDIWMSNDISRRKKFIQEHLHEYINYEE